MTDIASKVKLFLDAVQDVETFVYCSEISDISSEELRPILEKTFLVSKLATDLCKAGLSIELENKLIQLNIKHVQSMNFVGTLPEKVLCKLMHPTVESDVCLFTVEYFIKNLGEDWFEKCCINMAQMRQGFLAVSSMSLVLCGVEEIHASLLLEGWAKTLTNMDAESKLDETLDEMLSLEGSYLLMSKVCTSEVNGRPDKKKVIHLVNKKIAQTLIDSFKPELWEVVAASRIWFCDLVVADARVLDKVFEELHLSAQKYTEAVNKDPLCPSICFTVQQAVKITSHLLRFERTYNRTKNLLVQRSSEFWSLIKQGSLTDHVNSISE